MTQANAVNPADFVSVIDNAYFPLQPGTTYITESPDGSAVGTFSVTRQTRVIDGVTCVVVSDIATVDGELSEKTTDYFAQDKHGNVWYFGEDTAELDRNGRITSREGTWLAGRDGAEPGIYMPAKPHVGQSGRQEYYRRHAEDRFRVAAVIRSVSGAPVSVLTEETTPLEPGVVDNKLYVRGVGTVTELTVKGGSERNQLISVTRAH